MLAKWFVNPLDKNTSTSNIIICKKATKKKCFALFIQKPTLHFYLFKEKKGVFDSIFSLLSCLDYIYIKKDNNLFLEKILKDQKYKVTSCLILKTPKFETFSCMSEILSYLKKKYSVITY